MRPDVLIRTLTDDRRVLAGWAIGATLAGCMYAAFYPQLAGGQMAEAVAAYPQAMRQALRLDDLSSPAGYLGSSVFGLILPLIAMFYGAATGARTLAGDEEAGRLDLVLAHPVSRTGLVVQRFAALTAGAVVIAVAVWAGMLTIRGAAQLREISVGEFAAQCATLALLATVFGAVAIGIGAATGRRGLVFTVTAAVGILSYALHAFAGQLGLDAGKYLSPFYYYIGAEPLRHGMPWGHAAVLAVAALLLTAAGTVVFNRRDLNT
ncbi:ABC transporter permease [Actinoplanes philippinensis]|uniref:ABC-2 type transport system permease protein n=1 Tax=Actinoplanes philippinensis TaxID=35752 RepID=A0A1I2IF78_9ACTN|nr:ABC transporter permease subunit [Actinoplanes philippinensis]GIE78437.1 ABC transporter permease [Actinoplanes philippinensis]SFF39201.1 ABC-2 type transport system permease protein [Actinoplanes philippinensis]